MKKSFLTTLFLAAVMLQSPAVSGCGSGSRQVNDLPLEISPIRDAARQKTVKLVLRLFPASDELTRIVKVPKYMDYGGDVHRKNEVIWEKQVRKLQKGAKVPGSLADVYYVGCAGCAPQTLTDAYKQLGQIDPDTAARVNACTEFDGSFIFSVGEVEQENPERLYEKFCCVKAGRALYLIYDNCYVPSKEIGKSGGNGRDAPEK